MRGSPLVGRTIEWLETAVSKHGKIMYILELTRYTCCKLSARIDGAPDA